MAYQKTINETLFPEGEEILSWIKDLGQWGHRKTGTPQGRKSAEYIENKMKAFGLEKVTIEKHPSLCMFTDDFDLEIEGEKIESFYINGTNRGGASGRFTFGADRQKSEFVYVGQGLEEDFERVDVSGKIAVCSVYLPETDHFNPSEWFETCEVYDPEDHLNDKCTKVDIYSPDIWPNNYYLAQTHGAVGFIGILENYMDDPYFFNEDYTENGWAMGCEYMSLPGLWVSRSTGRKLKEKFAKEETLKGRLYVDTRYEYKDGLDVFGILPGQSEDIILVHSHHDAACEGAVQDASGISEMMALAKYYAQIPREKREKTLMFAALDTHYTDYAANIGFVRKRKKVGDHILLDIAIEHIAKEAGYDGEYNLYETGQVETRLFYVSAAALYPFVADTVRAYDLKKSIVTSVPVGEGLDGDYVFHQDEVISDAFYFNESGVPIVSHVAGPQYLFHPSDTAARIPVEELKPVGMAFAEIAGQAMKTLE